MNRTAKVWAICLVGVLLTGGMAVWVYAQLERARMYRSLVGSPISNQGIIGIHISRSGDQHSITNVSQIELLSYVLTRAKRGELASVWRGVSSATRILLYYRNGAVLPFEVDEVEDFPSLYRLGGITGVYYVKRSEFIKAWKECGVPESWLKERGAGESGAIRVIPSQ